MLIRTLFPILETSEEEKARMSALNRTIDELVEQGEAERAQKLKKGSISRLTILYGPWICNFRCPNYCYTQGTSNQALTAAQTLEIIEQAKMMGAQATYWPGEGELTLLRTFWDIMDYQAENNLPAVLFTNGSIFHDDRLSTRILGIKSGDLVKSIREHYKGLHLYVKFWHSNQNKASEMVGVVPSEYPYETIKGRKVPLALAKLIEGSERDRVGVEVAVSRENYEDVITNILPTVNELGIYGYFEPVIFSGNAQGRQKDFSLTKEQYSALADIFASGGNYCDRRQSIELMVKGTKLTPGIAIPPREEDCAVDQAGKIKDLSAIFHNLYFRTIRKSSEMSGKCLCREYWSAKSI